LEVVAQPGNTAAALVASKPVKKWRRGAQSKQVLGADGAVWVCVIKVSSLGLLCEIYALGQFLVHGDFIGNDFAELGGC
jgi:hypothetical protein